MGFLLCALDNEIAYTKKRIDLDENLIFKISQGDTQALKELYHLTDTAIFGFALSILKNTHDAEDVMQDAYIKINQHAKNYSPQGKPMAWILTIVKNLALMKLRHSSNHTVSIDEQFNLDAGSDISVTTENKLILETLLNALTHEERTIVVLHAQTGMKHREIAQILDLPLATVLSKYSRAITKMKKISTI